MYKHNMHFNIETHYLHYIQEREKIYKKIEYNNIQIKINKE